MSKEIFKTIVFQGRELIVDEAHIRQAFWDCLRANDPEGAIELLLLYLNEINTRLQLGLTDIAFKTKNPTIKEVAKLMHRVTSQKQDVFEKQLKELRALARKVGLTKKIVRDTIKQVRKESRLKTAKKMSWF